MSNSIKACSILIFAILPAIVSATGHDTVEHQGVVAVDGERFTGQGTFRFAVVDLDGDLYRWTSDGSAVTHPNPPTDGVSVTVVNGVFRVALGDTTLTNMTAFPANALDDDNVVLRVWFDDGNGNGLHVLSPDVVFRSTPRALRAAEALRLPNVIVDDATGNVGIGSAAGDGEGAHLALAGVGEEPVAESSIGWNIEVDDANDFRIYRGGEASAFTITEDDLSLLVGGGNVGIGVTNPGDRLTVSGVVRSTSGGFRFPNGDTQAVPAFGDGHSLDAADGNPTNSVFVANSGVVGIRTTSPATGAAHIVGSGGGFLNGPNFCTTLIDNTNVPSQFIFGANVLQLQTQFSTVPNTGVNFVTFYDSGNQAIGAIEGNNNNGVIYKSGSADFAEFLPRMYRDEVIEPGDIVGIHGGLVTKTVEGADFVLVASTAPVVLGNAPSDEEDQGAFVMVAMLGQTPVNVRGVVESGDFIVAGAGDGGGIVIKPQNFKVEDAHRVIGRAWEASGEASLKQVNTSIGLGVGAFVEQLADVVAERDASIRRIDDLEARLGRLEAMLQDGGR